jgi:mannose-6-phosphate isomerase
MSEAFPMSKEKTEGGMKENLQIYEMSNPIQNYAWGSFTAIAELMGSNEPSDQPQAEIWMGAHPKAPSSIRYQGAWHRLDQVIGRHPESFIGITTMDRFGDELPFLLKILAVSRPLSIQAHPNAIQAKRGFALENKQKIELNADHRNYKDDRHKPECICALTPFWGLCGFRSKDEMLRLAESVWPGTHRPALEILQDDGIKPFFEHLMMLPMDKRIDLVSLVIERTRACNGKEPLFSWMLRLQQQYPGDIGVLSPLLLNLVELKPGQALFLDAGQLHAYLDGVGVELMANSDNVLRGGLTPKHVDVPELLNILDFSAMRLNILEPQVMDTSESYYPSPVDDFRLSVIAVRPSKPYICDNRSPGPEIVLCTDSAEGLQCRFNRLVLPLSQGRSLFIPAEATDYSLHGSGTVYKASINS